MCFNPGFKLALSGSCVYLCIYISYIMYACIPLLLSIQSPLAAARQRKYFSAKVMAVVAEDAWGFKVGGGSDDGNAGGAAVPSRDVGGRKVGRQRSSGNGGGSIRG